MSTITILIVVACLATVVVLGSGLVSMMRGGKFDEQHMDQFMFGRVALQLLTLVLLVIAAYLSTE
jgi:hypothetical protein